MKSYLLILLVPVFVLIGCQEQGASEKAGERIDEIIDNVKDGDAPLKEKGAMEKMGESIDETIDDVEESTK